MQQIVLIHGGSTYSSEKDYLQSLHSRILQYERLLYHSSWKSWIARKLTVDGYDVLTPTMPNSANAQYDEWSSYFDKVVPFLNPDVQLVGHSLGGIFLARYLTTHPQVCALRLILIAAPYDDEANESLGDFRITSPLNLQNKIDEVHLFHSTDDPVVVFAEADKYTADLIGCQLSAYTDRQHFNQETFIELYDLLKTK